LNSIPGVELLQDVRNVRLRGVLGDDQFAGYFRIRQASRDESQDLDLAGRESRQHIPSLTRCCTRKALDQPFCDGRRKERAAIGHDLDSPTSCSSGASLSKNPLAPARSDS
jgi:hypothetical protein